MPPVMPGYVHADVPHEKTVAGPEYRYGCHSKRVGGGPRGCQTGYVAHPWSARGGEHVETTWIEMACGHSTRATDGACEGCGNRSGNAEVSGGL